MGFEKEICSIFLICEHDNQTINELKETMLGIVGISLY